MALSAPAYCWAPAGHETVGAIADRLIAGTHAARQVRGILGPNETLQTAAVWADCVKGVSETPPYRFRVEARYPECKPFSRSSGRRAMESYVRRNLDACVPQPGEERCHRQYHYVNLALQREGYAQGAVGVSDHDVVAALRACIAVLRGQSAPPPFSFQNQREALRVLTHLVGDIHQPLHVGSVYLDAMGGRVDPDASGYTPASFTRGGNNLRTGSGNMHGLWDSIPVSLQVAQFVATAQNEARLVPATTGAVEEWPARWANESLRAARQAFEAVRFGAEVNAGTQDQYWLATLPADYSSTRLSLQRQRLIEGGARLAQVLQAIWP
ncbi:MAG TPA: S1/P1 nuclease [Steroidobacteraceae bacterium]|nr:S1/P1 nuclease [Steroidobacteraceae bacterium]